MARAKFTGIERRTSRVEHVQSPDGFVDAGPGLVLAVETRTSPALAKCRNSDGSEAVAAPGISGTTVGPRCGAASVEDPGIHGTPQPNDTVRCIRAVAPLASV